MKQKGLTLIALLIVIAIFSAIAAIILPTMLHYLQPASNNETATNETMVDNATIFQQLSSEPITSLDLAELKFMVDYCTLHSSTDYGSSLPGLTYWAVLATVYQNQILIMDGGQP